MTCSNSQSFAKEEEGVASFIAHLGKTKGKKSQALNKDELLVSLPHLAVRAVPNRSGSLWSRQDALLESKS